MKIRASYHQERMFFIDRFEKGVLYPDAPVYHNIPLLILLEGELQEAHLQKSLEDLQRRHEPLRTTLQLIGDEVWQVIGEDVSIKLNPVKLALEMGDGEVRKVAVRYSQIPFDLEKDPLVRATLFKQSLSRNWLLLDFHHAIMDRPSCQMVVEELKLLYQANCTDMEADPIIIGLPEPALQYGDFAEWQKELPEDALESLVFYWRSRLLPRVEVLNFPEDFPRAAIHTYEEGRANLSLGIETSRLVKEFAQEHHSDPKKVLFAAFKILLSRWSGQQEIVTGTSMSNRQMDGMEQLFGPVSNLVVLNDQIDPEATFLQILERVSKTLDEAEAHQAMPFDLLVREINPEKDMSRTALFDVLMEFHDRPLKSAKAGSVTFTPEEFGLGWGKNDLNLQLTDHGDEIRGTIVFNRDHHRPATVETLANCFKTLLKNALEEPEKQVGLVKMLTQEEERKLLHQWNPRPSLPESEETLIGCFDEMVGRFPDRVALTGSDRSYTYRELNDQVDLVAGQILAMSKGSVPQFIGVLLDRSPEMVTSMLAVLKCGSAYVPLDPAYPSDRINFMLEDSGCGILISDGSLLEAADLNYQGPILDLAAKKSPAKEQNDFRAPSPNDAAYVIYTSGTSGTPKGCMVSHRNVLRLFRCPDVPLKFDEDDVWIVAHSFCFDFSVWEMYGALLHGGRLVIPPVAQVRDVGEFVDRIRAEKVTVLNQTPQAFYALSEYELESGEIDSSQVGLADHLRYVIFGGDKLDLARLREWVDRYDPQQINLINMYGITETTVHVTWQQLRREMIHAPHIGSIIGHPIPETTIYLLDAHQNPVPVGVSGEMYVGGAGVAIGYLNRPALNAQKFLGDPATPQIRLYRSGDLARRLHDGSLEYLGRGDSQVKIRGFRIELGEIEARLGELKGVASVAVGCRKSEQGEDQLVAWLILQESIDLAEIKSGLSEKVPGYMVPAHFVVMDRFPLSSNGKLDRAALPEPNTQIQARQKPYQAPRNATEKTLVEIWAEFLSSAEIGVTDSFFELGGHSLMAFRMVSRIRQVMGEEVKLKDFFADPTIANIAECISSQEKSAGMTFPELAEADFYPTSYAQRRLWVLDQIDEDRVAYNMPAAVVLTGELDAAKLENAFNGLIQRHESLRTVFADHDGTPVQVVLPDLKVNLVIEDMRQDNNPLEKAKIRARQHALSPFDLEKGPLIKLDLLQIADSEYILLFNMHHIISDGWSMGVLVKDLMHFYERAVSERKSSLRIQYRHFSAWEREYLGGTAAKESQEYWHGRLAGPLPVLNFPTDAERPPVRTYHGKSLMFQIDEKQSKGLQQLARTEDASTFMVVVALVKALLYRYSGQEDLIVGSPFGGRNHADLEDQVGFFINTVALRDTVHPEKSFGELLGSVRETVTGALSHQNYPFDKLIDELEVERDMSRNPVFDVMVVLQNNEIPTLSFSGIELKPFPTNVDISKFDLTFSFSESDGKLIFAIQYNTDLYSEEKVQGLGRHLNELVLSILEEPGQSLGTLGMLSRGEKARLLETFNSSKYDYPLERSVPGIFREIAGKFPQNIAVQETGKSLSFADLDRFSDSLAAVLMEKGAGKGKVVALHLDRSSDLITSSLAVLKAGAAFLPIDPSLPEGRKKFMVEEAGCVCAVTMHSSEITLPEGVGEVTFDQGDLLSGTPKVQFPELNGEDLAYIIFTSGSTGQPKGVQIRHKSLLNLSFWHGREFAVHAESKGTMYAGVGFDASQMEYWPYLLKGAAVYPLEDNIRLDFDALGRFWEENEITHSFLPTAVVDQIGDRNFPPALTIFTGGEALRSRSFPNGRLINDYGPAENTVVATFFPVEGEFKRSIPIGKPIDNTRIYLLDAHFNLVPVGVPGQICIAGASISVGYINQAERTAQAFVDDPFHPGEKMYLSGDLGRWLPDGNLEYQGRLDKQVQIRGHRVEPGEVEHLIRSHSEVNTAIVLPFGPTMNPDGLVAYFVPHKGKQPDLTAWLSGQLPDYMLPRQFFLLPEMPLTVNGKIDRTALPKYQPDASTDSESPSGSDEILLAGIWKEILNLNTIGRQDNFFHLGGDSIKAIQVSSRLGKYEKKLGVREILRAPVLAEMAALMESATETIDQGARTGLYPLDPIQKWFLGEEISDHSHWNQSFIFSKEGRYESEWISKSLSRILEHHDALRSVVRQGKNGPELELLPVSTESFPLEIYDLQDDEAFLDTVEAHANRINRELDLEHGPLIKAALFRGKDVDGLLMVIHHLAVDGVSWRILMEDFSLLYDAYEANRSAQLPAKTNSVKDWNTHLVEIANGGWIAQQIPYWQKLMDSSRIPLPILADSDAFTTGDSFMRSFSLDTENSRSLIREAHQAYNTEISELLLCGLVLAVHAWCGCSSACIELEGHGREVMTGNLDVNRTMGWFTSFFPVNFSLDNPGDIGKSIRQIKEQLKAVPNKGAGFGPLQYLRDQEDWDPGSISVKPQVSFNYLGHFSEEDSIRFTSQSAGETVCPSTPRTHEIVVNSSMLRDSFNVRIDFHPEQIAPEEISKFGESFIEMLARMVQHCKSVVEPVYSPSDFGRLSLPLEVFDQVYRDLNGQIERILPLTSLQEGMLYHAIVEPDSPVHFEQMNLHLSGSLNAEVLEASFNQLIERHQILRTTFVHEGLEQPVQVVMKSRPIKLKVASAPVDDSGNWVDDFSKAERKQLFDLYREPALRASLLETGPDSYLLMICYHHILLDGWSTAIFFRELFAIYEDLLAGRPVKLSAPVPFERYFDWLENQDSSGSREYWQGLLEGYESPAGIPGKDQQESQEFDSILRYYKFEPAVSQGLLDFGKKNNLTPNVLLQALWGVLLQRYNTTDDVVFGHVVSGRPAEIKGVEEILGILINTVPVRVQIAEDSSFASLAKNLKEQSESAQAHEHFSLAEIQADSPLNQKLIDHLVVFSNFSFGSPNKPSESTPDLAAVDTEVIEQINYDLGVNFFIESDISVKFTFNRHKYEEETFVQLEKNLACLAAAVVADPHRELCGISLVPDSMVDRLIADPNPIPQPVAEELNLAALFAETALQYPNATCLVCEDRRLSYREVHEQSDRLAAYLHAELELGAGDFAGIMLERSEMHVIAALGILKAGAAFVPIDKDWPEERKKYIYENARIKVLLTSSESIFDLEGFEGGVFAMDLQLEGLEELPSPAINTKANDPAYVIYTSGSTGKPKGVIASHGGVIRLVRATNYIEISLEDRILSLSSFSFDGSTFDVFGALLNGAACIIAQKEHFIQPSILAGIIEKESVSAFFLTTALFNLIVDEHPQAFASVRKVLFGGEKISVDHARRFVEVHGPGKLVHVYGPTENTTFSTWHPIDEVPADATNVPIGKAICNSGCLVLDEHQNLVPPGMIGELCVYGQGLALGYLGDEELTGKKFIPHPFESGARLYRTGDLVRMQSSGEIVFVGRTDQQVKIRGFRIEPDEIRSQIANHALVKEAVVLVHENEEVGRHLVAFLTLQEELDMSALTAWLRLSLPEYMIPAHFVVLEQMPLNPNGKIDLKALPRPDYDASDNEYSAPESPAEIALAAIWEDILGRQNIGVTDNFFDLGGHSLKAVRVINRIKSQFGVDIGVDKIFVHNTIKGLATELAGAEKAIAEAPIPALESATQYAPSYGQKRLWVLSKLDARRTADNMFSANVLNGALDITSFRKALDFLISRHEILRTTLTEVDREMVQVIHPVQPFALEQHDLCAADSPKEEAKELARKCAGTVFDLQKGPLIRGVLVQLAEQKHAFFIVMHHAISDAWSLQILAGEVLHAYRQLNAGGQFELPPLSIQYKDFAAWQTSLLEGPARENLKKYWSEVLQPPLPLLQLPLDFTRPEVKTESGAMLKVSVPKEEIDALQQMAQEHSVTVFSLVLAVYFLTLHRYSGQDDIVLGSPVAGRDHSDLHQQVGFYVNMLSFRSHLDESMGFVDFLRSIHGQTVQALNHQQYPFDLMVQDLNPERDPSRSMLFDAGFTWNIFEGESGETVTELTAEAFPVEVSKAKHDLWLFGSKVGDNIWFEFNYNTDLYRESRIEAIATVFKEVIAGIIATPDTSLSDLIQSTPELETDTAPGSNSFNLNF